jgi:hypothetical protein
MELMTLSYTASRGWSQPLPSLDSPQTLVLAFAAPEYMERPAPLAELASAFPNSHLIGCSTAGEITGREVHDESISVAVVKLGHSRIALASTEISEADSRAAGARLAQQLDPHGLRAVLVFAEGLDVNGSELVEGICSKLPRGVVVTGGLAGDGERFQGTWVLRAGRPQRGAIVAAGLYGERLRIGYGTRGGWEGFGPERRITRAKGNVLYELDHKPALALYKEYLGEHAADLPGSALYFPLALRSAANGAEQLVRCIAGVDESEQSITFCGDMPAGHLAQLTQANLERLIGGAGEAALAAQATLQAGGARASAARASGPVLGLTVTCAGRRVVLGERAEEEVESAALGLPAGTQHMGFYAYGEIAPYGERICDLHNQTLTVTTLAED